MAWSPNGKWIASAGDDTTVQVWNPFTGQALLTFRQHTQQVNALAWSPDSTRIVSASGEPSSAGKSQVFVWDAATGKVLLTYTGNPTQVNAGSIQSLAWSPDGTRISPGVLMARFRFGSLLQARYCSLSRLAGWEAGPQIASALQ